MLEIKNLTKVYKTKNGAETVALAGVSLKFGERGMVFLLGKSGSGKSTLLNLCGGLDSPDSGEVIIKGRSSRDFSQSDFDSYRNTFVGFVFQEYNILNEFTVEENIALALELQGKSKNSERVREILEQVELQDFAKRKPNTLSGGQKQRVAIARALVKNPEIIMADEPTGALDSETGRQVFETLKKLSADKLVIVVSHDREFAALYGDRIIELKDGKVISDVTKTVTAAECAGENVSFLGDDAIAVKSGQKLSESDVERINEFLLSAPKDVMILRSEEHIAEYKKAMHIDEHNGVESFEQTDEDDIDARTYTPEESRFIRSSLPIRHAVKIGASSMKVKPFRLFFTILLTFISFTMFGLFSTMTFFDPLATEAQTYIDSYYEELPIIKQYVVRNYYTINGETEMYESAHDTGFGSAEYKELKEKYGDKALGVFNYSETATSHSRFIFEGSNELTYYSYFSAKLIGFAEFDREAWRDAMLTDTDLNALGPNDIIISSYTFDSLKALGVDGIDGHKLRLNDYGDIVGCEVEITAANGNSEVLTVAGVYRNDPPQKFAHLKGMDSDQMDDNDFTLADALQRDTNYSSYCIALVGDDFYEAHKTAFSGSSPIKLAFDFTYPMQNAQLSIYESDGSILHSTYVYGYGSLPAENGDDPAPYIMFFDERTDAALNDGEIVIGIDSIYGISDAFYELYDKKHDEIEALDDEQLKEQKFNELDIWYYDFWEYLNRISQGYTYDDNGSRVYLTAEQLAEAMDGIREVVNYGLESGIISDEISIDNSGGPVYGNYKLAGYMCGTLNSDYGNCVYLSPDDKYDIVFELGTYPEDDNYNREETNYVPPKDAKYSSVILPMPSDGEVREIVYNRGNAGEDDSYIMVYSAITNEIDSANFVIEMLSEVFLWIGVVMAVFAMLLLFNFISVSITYKKKEIGILRAVGARSADVFKIFYSESAIITIICYVLAAVASNVVCFVLNEIIASTLMDVSLFVFGPLSWLVMAGIAVATSLIATFLPVYAIAKRKPVESIRAL